MNNHKSPNPLLERGKIILPNEMKIKQQLNQPTEVQIPIFPIPVQSSGSFLIYALCLQAIESGMYADMPAIAPHLQTIKSVMEQEYLRFGISMYEYRQFVILPKKDVLSVSTKDSESVLSVSTKDSESVLSVSQPCRKVMSSPPPRSEACGETDKKSFCRNGQKDDNACSPPNQATNIEEVSVRANITWEDFQEALLNLVNQHVIKECLGLGGEENAEMGTQKQEKE